MDPANTADVISDFDPTPGNLVAGSHQPEPDTPADAGSSSGQGDATVLAWARAM